MPNTYDTVAQSQHQNITTYNIAPGYSRVIGTQAVLSANGFVRHDHLTYSPSPDPFDDTPATVSQDRTLTNSGVKVGRELPGRTSQHQGRRDVQLRPSCTRTSRSASPTRPTRAFADENGDFNPALAPFDLTNGGSPLLYDQSFTDQTAGGLRPGRDRRPDRRRSSSACASTTTPVSSAARRPSRGSACRTPCRTAARFCARRTAGRWRRRTTRTCCSRAATG